MADPFNWFTLVFIILPLGGALALGFAPLHLLVRRWGRTNPGKLQLAVFVSAWILSWVAAAGITARLLYAVAYFYFDTTFGLVSGVTRPMVQSQAWGVLVEIFLRQIFGWLVPLKCFSASGWTCELAAAVGRTGSLGISATLLAFFPALMLCLLARWLVTRRDQVSNSFKNRLGYIKDI